MPGENENMENDVLEQEIPEEENLEVNLEETSEEENQEEVDTTKDKETEENEEDIVQKRIDDAVKKRLKREQRKNKELYEIEDILKKQLGVEESKDLKQKLYDFYQIKPEITTNKHDSVVLGESDAQDFIEDSDISDIKERANELASLKEKGEITPREDAEFLKLGSYLTEQNRLNELKEKGIDQKILEDKSFKEFSKKFNKDVPISDVYSLYSKFNNIEPEKPASTGSIKSSGGENREKTFYTSEDVDKLSQKDLDNPTIFKNVMASMKKWKAR